MIKSGKFCRVLFTVLLCMAVVAPGVSFTGRRPITVYAAEVTTDFTKYEANGDLAGAKKAALTELADYYNQVVANLSASKKKAVTTVYNAGVKAINNVQNVTSVKTVLKAQKDNIEGQLSLEETRKNALTSLETYYKSIIEGMGDADKASAKRIYDNYTDAIKKLTDAAQISASLSEAKEALSKIADKTGGGDGNEPDGTTPSSSSDLIMVGGNWVTPTARYNQYVSVVLPVVNMMQGIHLTNVIVTPVVAANTSEWPFEIETSGYTQTIPELPGVGNGQNDMDRRRELTWNFKVKDNVLNGYYKVPFLVNYIDPASGENVQVTLTTYVLCVGAPGSGNVEEDAGKYSTPRVIVTGYDTEPAEVYAGDVFTLTMHLKNTSSNTSVSNMLVHLTTPTEGSDADSSYAAFMPTSGSNTFYVDKIGKGGTTDLSIEMKAKNDLSQKPYSLDINMEYEDENINSYTSSSDISIQVRQNARFEFSSMEILPSEITVGGQSNVMFSIYNTGQVPLYNAHLNFKADNIEADELYLGKIESSGTGNVDAMITALEPSKGEGIVKVILTYEDENAETYTYEEEIKLLVSEDIMPDDSMMYDELEFDYEEEEGPNKLVIGIIIAVCVVILIVVIVIVLKKRRRKKEDAELAGFLDDLEEIQGKDDGDEIS